ncbi:MAG: lauroyl acyltransferase [Bacteroidia bacterium]|nr:lauroyl acyltransferase [Bacteroidia bacterium]
MNDSVIYAIGFIAQILFSSRLLVQWIKSEKAGKVLSPTLFWKLSLLASCTLIIYGVLRQDIVIILGQAVSYYIYIRNLRLKREWFKFSFSVRFLALVLPPLSFTLLLMTEQYNLQDILFNASIPAPVLYWGGIGQIIFTFRFVYQWLVSEKKNESVLPIGFWLISLTGSLIMISYFVIRLDYVLIIGHLFGITVYTRNIMLWIKDRKVQKSSSQ